MTSVWHLLRRLSAFGIEATVVARSVRLTGTNTPPDELMADLRAHKAALIAALSFAVPAIARVSEPHRDKPPTTLPQDDAAATPANLSKSWDASSNTGPDWQAMFNIARDVAMKARGLAEAEAETVALETCVVRWRDQNPAIGSPGVCCFCSTPGDGGRPLLPFGVTKIALLHQSCWRPWSDLRDRDALEALRRCGLKEAQHLQQTGRDHTDYAGASIRHRQNRPTALALPTPARRAVRSPECSGLQSTATAIDAKTFAHQPRGTQPPTDSNIMEILDRAGRGTKLPHTNRYLGANSDPCLCPDDSFVQGAREEEPQARGAVCGGPLPRDGLEVAEVGVPVAARETEAAGRARKLKFPWHRRSQYQRSRCAKRLRPWQVDALFDADAFAARIGCPLVTFVTIRWARTSKGQADIPAGWFALLKATNAWAKRQGVSLAYAYVHENPDRLGGGFNSHLLVSVRPPQRDAFADFVARHLGGETDAVRVEARCQPGHKDRRLHYMTKGTDRATAQKYGLITGNGWDFAQGVVEFKRCGTSANIGPAVRNAVGHKNGCTTKVDEGKRRQ
jgi:hypothetical protein